MQILIWNGIQAIGQHYIIAGLRDDLIPKIDILAQIENIISDGPDILMTESFTSVKNYTWIRLLKSKNHFEKCCFSTAWPAG